MMPLSMHVVFLHLIMLFVFSMPFEACAYRSQLDKGELVQSQAAGYLGVAMPGSRVSHVQAKIKDDNDGLSTGCLPLELYENLDKKGGKPYDKIMMLWEYAQKRKDTLQGSSDLRSFGGNRFHSLPADVQQSLKSGKHALDFADKHAGSVYVAHSEEIVPNHFLEFTMTIPTGSKGVSVGWIWAMPTSNTTGIPSWLQECLCQSGDDPFEKLNRLVERINTFQKENCHTADSITSTKGFEALDLGLQDVLRLWGKHSIDKKKITPLVGVEFILQEAPFDSHHTYQCLGKISGWNLHRYTRWRPH